jgi:hypothetical protein
MLEGDEMDRKDRQRMFEARHGKVWLHTDICDAWLRHHKNCNGCKHQKQCSNLVKWILSILSGYDPEEYLDDPSKYNPIAPEGE